MRAARYVVLAMALSPLVGAIPAGGQQVFTYPQRGQTPEQQSRDRYECHTWAVQQTGFDPASGQVAQAAPPPPPMSAPPPPTGGALRGAGRGAAIGAVGGAIGGDAGKGAAIGAATGGMIGAMRQKDEYRRQQQEQAQRQSQYQAQQQATQSSALDGYNRALSACLGARGYTVR